MMQIHCKDDPLIERAWTRNDDDGDDDEASIPSASRRDGNSGSNHWSGECSYDTHIHCIRAMKTPTSVIIIPGNTWKQSNPMFPNVSLSCVVTRIIIVLPNTVTLLQWDVMSMQITKAHPLDIYQLNIASRRAIPWARQSHKEITATETTSTKYLDDYSQHSTGLLMVTFKNCDSDGYQATSIHSIEHVCFMRQTKTINSRRFQHLPGPVWIAEILKHFCILLITMVIS